MVEFKIGDRIKIREWDDMQKDFGLDKYDCIPMTPESFSTYTFIPEMKHLCGRTATITDIKLDEIKLDFDNKSGDTDWIYHIGMIEFCDEVSELKREIETLNAKIRELEKNKADVDILANYKIALTDDAWVEDMSEDDNVYQCGDINNWDDHRDNYMVYPTEEYAKKAYKIHKLNGMLLAFKWCYDKNYDPDYSDDTNKYVVVYKYNEDDTTKSVYYVDSNLHWCHNTIVFSSHEIAQKCADWLNEIDPYGELIL